MVSRDQSVKRYQP